MKLAPIVSLLHTVPAFAGRVEAATTLESAIEKARNMPGASCVVHGVTETIDALQYKQERTVNVALNLLIVMRNVGDMRGAAAYELLDDVLTDYRAVLHGAVPAEGYSALAHNGGSFAWAESGTLIWLDEFTTRYQAPL